MCVCVSLGMNKKIKMTINDENSNTLSMCYFLTKVLPPIKVTNDNSMKNTCDPMLLCHKTNSYNHKTDAVYFSDANSLNNKISFHVRLLLDLQIRMFNTISTLPPLHDNCGSSKMNGDFTSCNTFSGNHVYVHDPQRYLSLSSWLFLSSRLTFQLSTG